MNRFLRQCIQLNLAKILRIFFLWGLTLVWVLIGTAGNLRSQDSRGFGAANETVQALESLWQSQYEGYFERDFPSSNLSAEAISDRLAALSQTTGHPTAVLWLAPRPDRIREILILPNRQIVRRETARIPQSELTALLNRFVQSLANPPEVDDRSYLEDARLLYRWLIAPLAIHLEDRGIETILFCPGPGLRSLPLAALHDGRQFLIEKYSLARIPAFNLLDLNPHPLDRARVLAMGASQFESLPSLPGVSIEIPTITPGLWQGTGLLDRDFTIANLKQQQRQSYGIIHLATHAQFVAGEPERSFIQFADAPLTIADIPRLDWSDSQISLLVLSACETAVGDRQAELGFAGLALQAGIPSAIATLWQVSDLGTVALMGEFYRQLKADKSKAVALQRAQIALLSGRVALEGNRLRGSPLTVPLPESLTATTSPDFSHPFFWAGFSLIGSP